MVDLTGDFWLTDYAGTEINYLSLLGYEDERDTCRSAGSRKASPVS
jgi:hypothetical protein